MAATKKPKQAPKVSEQPVIRWNVQFPHDTPEWFQHVSCIRSGGQWTLKDGTVCGRGNFFHYKALQKIIWPNLDHHRWSDLLLHHFLGNQITVVIGPKSSGKTHCACRWILIDYLCFAEKTTILCSTTTLASLELRIWGEIKKLLKAARKVLPTFPGHVIEHKHCISTDLLRENEVKEPRDLRNGIIGIACKQGTTDTGLANYVGIKNDRVRLIGDELQFMGEGFLEGIGNLDSSPDFKAGLLGNPKAPTDPLGQAAEPPDGWATHPEPDKTAVWDSRFLNSKVVNLVGTDSPNFDVPEEEEVPYPRLIHRKMIKNVESFWGKESHHYYSQCKGVMKVGVHARRVLTKSKCKQNHAFDAPIWLGSKLRRIYALDIAYGSIGGDRCIGGMAEFGLDSTGNTILALSMPELVPVSVKIEKDPEDQIAEWLKARLIALGIPPADCFYDSTGRGTMGTAFAKVFGYTIPVPVEFGGAASKRPVRDDMMVFDRKDGRMRLKRCDEHYRKFVTEIWFSAAYAVEAGQVRGLTDDVAEEMESREWMEVEGGRIEVEKKEDTRERTGHSPDKGDWFGTIVEGARQRGFRIRRIGGDILVENSSADKFDGLRRKHYENIKKRQLILQPGR